MFRAVEKSERSHPNHRGSNGRAPNTGLRWPSSTTDGQKDSGQVMPEFDCIFTVPRTLKIQFISFILRSVAWASPTACPGKDPRGYEICVASRWEGQPAPLGCAGGRGPFSKHQRCPPPPPSATVRGGCGL